MTPPRLQVITPVYPPAAGGIETLTEGIVRRWPGPVEVCTLVAPGSDEWDARARYRVHRASNVPRGGRRSMTRLTAMAVARALRFRPDIVLSMHVRCSRSAHMIQTLAGARWVQYYHAKEIVTWRSHSRRCIERADHGIAVSRYTKSLVESVATPPGPLSVIPPGVAMSPGLAPTPGRGPTILTVARIDDAY